MVFWENVQKISDRLKRELGGRARLQLQELKAREAKVEVGSQMEENEGGGGGTGTETYSHIWWALASAAQLVWAISSNHMKLQHKPFSSRTTEYWSLLKLCVFFFVVHLTWLNMLSAYLLYYLSLNDLLCVSFKIHMIENWIRMLRSPYVIQW